MVKRKREAEQRPVRKDGHQRAYTDNASKSSGNRTSIPNWSHYNCHPPGLTVASCRIWTFQAKATAPANIICNRRQEPTGAKHLRSSIRLSERERKPCLSSTAAAPTRAGRRGLEA